MNVRYDGADRERRDESLRQNFDVTKPLKLAASFFLNGGMIDEALAVFFLAVALA